MGQSVKISYAQNREDIILEALIGGAQTGFYVDVGANDPHKDSVTKRFYLKGWHGLNIEPNRLLWERLQFDRKRDVNLQIGIGAKNETLTFREYPDNDGLSTFSEAVKRQNEQTYAVNHKDYKIVVKTLTTVFKEYNVSVIDFMKIDVGGYEWEVICGNDWEYYRPKVLCIEANHTTRLQERHIFFDNHNYKFVFFDGINEYYRDETQGPWPAFSYPKTILAPSIVTYSQYKQQTNLKATISQLTHEVNFAKVRTQRLARDIEMHVGQIENQQREIRRLQETPVAFKSFIKGINDSINQRIESMNTAPVVTHDLALETGIRLDANSSHEILKKVQLFDYANSYKRTITLPRPYTLKYRILKFSYGTIKKMTKLTIKGAKRIKRAL